MSVPVSIGRDKLPEIEQCRATVEIVGDGGLVVIRLYHIGTGQFGEVGLE